MASTPEVVAIVDDDAAVRKSIEQLLQTCGYSTASFADAEAFIRSELADSVTGLVLDSHLEGMSGMDLCRYLNFLETTVPIVLITAHGDTAMRAEAAELGCIACLLKPFRASSLEFALERCRGFGSKRNAARSEPGPSSRSKAAPRCQHQQGVRA